MHLLKCTRKRGSASPLEFRGDLYQWHDKLDTNVVSSPLKFDSVISGTHYMINTFKESIPSIYL